MWQMSDSPAVVVLRDAVKLACPWGKLAVYNNGSGQSVVVNSLVVDYTPKAFGGWSRC